MAGQHRVLGHEPGELVRLNLAPEQEARMVARGSLVPEVEEEEVVPPVVADEAPEVGEADGPEPEVASWLGAVSGAEGANDDDTTGGVD